MAVAVRTQRFTGAERRVLECLGAALVIEWNDLPTDVQRRLFEHVASGKSHDADLLKARIARFLHDQKTIGLRAKFRRFSALLCMADMGIPAVRLSGPRSFFRDPGFRRPSTKCSGPATREYRLMRRRENGRMVKFELVANPARASDGASRTRPKRSKATAIASQV